MKSCEWTEKVSLLIDGELGAEEARAVETHVGDCLACRAAREDFLVLRRRISSYRPDINPLAQRAALENILAAGRGEGPAVGVATAARASDRRARFAELFALPRLSPGLVAASALVLVCVAVGVLVLRRDESRPVQVVENPRATAPAQSASAPTASPDDIRQGDEREAINSNDDDSARRPGGVEVAKIKPKVPGANEIAKGFRPKGVGGTGTDKSRPKGVSVAEAARAEEARMPREVLDVPFVIPPRVDVEERKFVEAEVAASEAPTTPDAAAPTALSASRHAEQAQMLLRSFRNASGAAGAPDLSYERERSQQLLYQNIVLRREAARGGKPEVESTLSQLETILLDIANLPEKPASEDVRSIKNRMERKNIVAMLQVAARD